MPLSVLSRINEVILNMFKYWCSCRNGKGLSLLNCVRQFDYVSDLRKLIELLAAFSSYIPGCCREIADLIGQEPKVRVKLFSFAVSSKSRPHCLFLLFK